MALFRRHHRHHHHHHGYNVSSSNSRLNWKRDKKMIIGIIAGVLALIIFAIGPGRKFVKETFSLIVIFLRPETEYDEEMKIDPIRVDWEQRLAREHEGDSVAALVGADTMRKEIRQKAVPVYRPPRPRNTWYLSDKDMQELRRGAEDRFNNED